MIATGGGSAGYDPPMLPERPERLGAAPKDPAERTAWYRARAAEFYALAETASDDAVRVGYETVAESYEALAAATEARLTTAGALPHSS